MGIFILRLNKELTKAFFGGALTGAISGALGQVFSASTFWATVGNGALAGAGGGGINALINGQNFLEGLVKGAVIGGAMGAISYTIKFFTSNNTENLTEADLNLSDIDTMLILQIHHQIQKY